MIKNGYSNRIEFLDNKILNYNKLCEYMFKNITHLKINSLIPILNLELLWKYCKILLKKS